MLRCDDADHQVRWRAGERLNHLFEATCDRLNAAGRTNHVAVSTPTLDITFSELDRRANRLARYLVEQGVGPGRCVALLLDKSGDAYVALLAVIKSGATFVPLDHSFPPDRIAYIAEDAGATHNLTLADYKSRFDGVGRPTIIVEAAVAAARGLSSQRLDGVLPDDPPDGISYIIYTSGSTGRPKGVAISHSSICNFVRVAGEVYGIRDSDRIYQGMTLAFDFSVEELWVPLIAGAAIVPGRSDATLVGRDLAAFLEERRVTGICCVPTLLATITDELPQLRFLLVSGEACPQDLVVRWYRPWRRMLNAYGPTEATVTASWTVLEPGKPVTIGQPLPTYTMVILGEDGRSLAPDGAVGEIGIAGPGLAEGYVNRPDLTAHSFIEDFAALPDNPSRRIYRTGDLGRINADREVEYLGRIDTQVKVRGYRIELTEIESALLEHPAVAQAVVSVAGGEGAPKELAAYVTSRNAGQTLDAGELARHLKSRLPGFMVPAYIVQLAEIPMLPSHKADRKRLPPPSGPRVTSSTADHVAPRTPAEQAVAEVLSGVLRLESVSVTDHVFDDLGADSLKMSEFVFALDARLPGASVSIRDVYLNPTVERLARLLSERRTATRADSPGLVDAATVRGSRLQHAFCGLLQFLYYSVVTAFWAVVGIELYRWESAATTPVDAYVRLVAAAALLLGLSIAIPVAAKWVLVGRYREERIPLWSLRYFRFWLVRQFVQTCPLVLFRGQPVYNWYLRVLGAKIGRGASINTRFSPACPDLLDVGDGAVLAKDTLAQTYRAERGVIVTGRVRIGRHAYVGEGSVLDIGSSIGVRGQLAHASSLQEGQAVPDGGSAWGSPAVPTEQSYLPVPERPSSRWRPAMYTALLFAALLFVLIPLLETAVIAGYAAFDAMRPEVAPLTWVEAGLSAVLISFVVYLAGIATGLVLVAVVPRLLAAAILRPDKLYPLYGFHYSVACLVVWLSNSYAYNVVFGDSSFIVHYLRLIGFDLGVIRQTGSNFGSHQRHDVPTLCCVGSGTMVSDGLSMINIRQSSSAFKLATAHIGAGSFLGNQVTYLADARLGTNNLIATKAMVPVGGEVLSDRGILGSPPFEIPRRVVTVQSFDPLAPTPERASRLRAKNWHNLVTLGQYLTLIWAGALLSAGSSLSIYMAYVEFGIAGAWLASVAGLIALPVYFVVMEVWGPGRLRLEPKNCTIHDLHFFRVERYWKMGETPLKGLFKGTPFRPWFYRFQGVRMGRMVFDDGCAITEKALVEIGDYCCLNEATSLQSHSLEDGLFKSDHIKLAEWCTLGPAAFVNYGVRISAGATLLADSFVMKGSIVGRGQIWSGNPARVDDRLRAPTSAVSEAAAA